MKNKKIAKNIIVGTMLVCYGLFNFTIEFIRENPIVIGKLTMGHFMNIIIVILGFYIVYKIKNL